MKNKSFWLLCVLVFAILLSGCATSNTLNIFDKDLPAEKSATLSFYPEWTLRSYNGIDIELKTGTDRTDFIIPAGKTELLMDLKSLIGYTYYFADNVNLTYNFEAGRKYAIRFWYINDEGKVPILGKGKLSLFISDPKDLYTALYHMELKFDGAQTSKVLK